MRLYSTIFLVFISIGIGNSQSLFFKDHLKIFIESNVKIMYTNSSGTENLVKDHFIFSDRLLHSIYSEDSTKAQKVKKYQEKSYRKSDYKFKNDTIFLDFWPYWRTIERELHSNSDSEDSAQVEKSNKEQRQGLGVNEHILNQAIPVTTVEIDSNSNDLKIKQVKYFLKLNERQSLKIKRRSFAVGAFTIPTRIHFSGSGNQNTFYSSGLSVGLFGAREFGNTRFYYSKLESKEITNVWGFGSFGMLSGQKLNSGNTSDKLTTETTEPYFSSGFVLYKRYDKINLFTSIGMDFPITSNGRLWDFSKRPWLGFGFGIDLFK